MTYRKKFTVEELQSKLEPSNQLSATSGGTADILPQERKKASFQSIDLTYVLDGGEKGYKRKLFIRGPAKNSRFEQRYDMTREEILVDDLKDFIKVHKSFSNFKATRDDLLYMSEVASVGGSSLGNHHMLFCATLAGQCNDEQYKEWFPRAMQFQFVGCYAQTELGHGSNVRGLETTATYDKNTQEFILNTPTLTSRKWWPGALGKVATHAAVYAQLIIDDKQYGIHSFLLQIRDENHKPLPGITLGDLGNKIGDGANDTGFMVLDNVRIPRQFLFSKYQHVEPDGTYVKDQKVNKQIQYATMMGARASMVGAAGARLATAATISVRYSCIRKQGFTDTSQGVDYKSSERQVIDYQVQQYRVFKQLCNAYAIKFTARSFLNKMTELEGGHFGHFQSNKDLKELAAASAGLKALCSRIAVDGMEDCRKCCGGNGYLLSSGLAAHACDYLWQVTAEGDQIILTLLTARFLIKTVQDIMGRGKKQTGMMSYLNQLLEPGFNMKKAAPVPAASQANFLDLDYLKSLFQFKAMAKILTAAQQLQKRIKKEKLVFEDAWNKTALDLFKAANAHGYHLLYEYFYENVQTVEKSEVQQVLQKVLALFACCNILDDDWAGILHPNQFELVKLATYELMEKIRPECVALVDAFDIPDNSLASTIGRYDGNVYEALVNTAERSILNREDPFVGFETSLKPHLNQEYLKQGNKWNPKPKL